MLDRQRRLEQAWSRHKEGDLAAAYESYRQLLQEQPNDARALHYLGLLLHQTGQSKAALELLSRSIAIDRHNARGLDHLGQIHASCKRLDEAEQCFRNALALEPNSTESMNNLANVLRKRDKLDEALRLYRRVIELNPVSREGHYNLGKLLRDMRAFEAAMAAFERAVAVDPRNHRAHYEMGLCLEELGRFDEAIARYRDALQVRPDHARTIANLISLRGFTADPALLARASGLAASDRIGDEERAKLHQALGKVHDRRGEFQRAFTHFSACNEIQKKWRNSDAIREAAADAEATIARFDAGYFHSVRELGHASTRPIFIVGMPRSGTTLVEQILASHPEAWGAGEQMEIPRIAATFAATDREAIQTAAERYLKHLERIAPPQATRVTDKLPINYRHLGLIATLFPRACVIHCQRDPRDVLLSCFIEMFSIRDQDFTDLHGIARAIITEHRLMRHWRTVLPVPIHEVTYHELIADQQAATRRLLEHCGLAWDERCLRFYSTERQVETPSRWQVRQPIYSSSEGRWRNYAQQLQPAIALLRAEGVIETT